MGKYGDADDIVIEWAAGMPPAEPDGRWWGLLDGGLGARFGWPALAIADDEEGGGEREREDCDAI